MPPHAFAPTQADIQAQRTRPSRPAPRVWRVTCAVLLAHVCAAWLVSAWPSQPATVLPQVVLVAHLVARAPTPVAPPATAPPPQPAGAAVLPPKPTPTPTPTPRPRPAQPNPFVATERPPEPEPAQGPARAPVQAQQPHAQANAQALAQTQAQTDGAASVQPAAAPHAPAAVVQPSSDADYLNNPAPVYPRLSRRMGEQGTALVRVWIGADGRPLQAHIRTSSGHARLDEVALATVLQWRFVPGQRAGVAQAMWALVPMRFVLD